MAPDGRLRFKLTPTEQSSLERLVKTASNGRLVRRAQALLWLQESESVTEIARRLRISRQSIYHWAAHFSERRGTVAERLSDGAHTGRPAVLSSRMDPIIQDLIDQDP